MKKNQKLIIKKEKISSLSSLQMNEVHGGAQKTKVVCTIVATTGFIYTIVTGIFCKSKKIC